MKQSFLKVDFHNHILPKVIPDFRAKYGYGDWISLRPLENGDAEMIKNGELFRVIEPNCFDPEVRIKECDEVGVDVQILSTVPVMFNYWAKPEHTLEMARYLNDDIAATCKKYPKRFVGLATLPMQAPELAIQELRRCVNELNLPGIQIGSHINDWNLNAPELFPIFQECEKLGVAIFVHPWDMMGKEKMERYWLPWLVGMPAETSLAMCSMIFGGIFERLPKLRVCFGHGGGSFPMTLGRIEHGFNCRPDLVAIDNKKNPREYIGRLWVDSIVHDHKTLDFLVDLMGEDFVMFGTDYPFPLGEVPKCGELIETSNFSQDTKKKLLGDNCLKFLGLDGNNFL